MYASKTSFGFPDEGSPSPGPESLYGSRQGFQVEEAGGMVEEQMLEEDENVEEVMEEEEEQHEQEPGEGEYLTMASILTVVPSLAKNDTVGDAKEEEEADDGGKGGGIEEDGGDLEDKEVEEINQQEGKEQEATR